MHITKFFETTSYITILHLLGFWNPQVFVYAAPFHEWFTVDSLNFKTCRKCIPNKRERKTWLVTILETSDNNPVKISNSPQLLSNLTSPTVNHPTHQETQPGDTSLRTWGHVFPSPLIRLSSLFTVISGKRSKGLSHTRWGATRGRCSYKSIKTHLI